MALLFEKLGRRLVGGLDSLPWRKIFVAAGAGVLLAVLTLAWLNSPPLDFPLHSAVNIKEGETLKSISRELRTRSVVRSGVILEWLVRWFGAERQVVAGDYVFEKKIGAWEVTRRLIGGRFGLTLARVTFPEGLNSREMSEVLAAALPEFDKENFLYLAAPLEGRLFPDTYFFSPGANEEEIAAKLLENFKRQISRWEEEIAASGRSMEEILVMASLLEKEAADTKTRQVISGILWKRLEARMLLQVDAVFPYLIGKNSFELTLEDLALDSPFNTYRYEGLPPAPITNPGHDSIFAALNPLPTPYWFYLSDRRGEIYYAVDFNEHRFNKQKYLR